jgi:5-methylcytosine-specific restriction endonuclease McrA
MQWLQQNMAINEALRQRVRERGNFVCEYCHSPERLSANRFTIDHWMSVSLGGSDDWDNLALACRRCNERKSNALEAIDPETNVSVPIFNPRQQIWNEHFRWMNAGAVIQGISAIGRATCVRLDLNDERYPEEDSIRATRRFWRQIGLHPPLDDRCEV